LPGRRSLTLLRRLSRLLHLAGGLPGLLGRRLQLGLGGLRRRIGRNPAQRAGERVGADRELSLGDRGPGTVRRPDLLVPLPLFPRHVFRLLYQVGKIALQSGAAEQLATALERFTQLLLHVSQLLERVLGPLCVQVSESLLQAGELLPKLR
jgi:hypothetical protein